MTTNASPGTRLLSSLGSADGNGVVRVQDRYDTEIDDMWSALTDPGRLARWYGRVKAISDKAESSVCTSMTLAWIWQGSCRRASRRTG